MRVFLHPSWAHAAEAHVLGTRCVAAGPLGLAWPPYIPCRALMRKNPRFRRFLFSRTFLTNSSVCPALAGAPNCWDERGEMAEPKEPPPFECALAELLEARGVSADLRRS